MTIIAVTGASGRAGRAVVRDLVAAGYEVRGVDVAPAPAGLGAPLVVADLVDYGEAVQALDGCDAVVHLANIPAPGLRPDAVTFQHNVAMNYAVFTAAARLGLDRVVWASSETTLGLPFDTPPRYLPIDEDHYPYPTTAYALSKVVSETIAEQVSRWSGLPFVALRFSNILGPAEYAGFPSHWSDVRARRWNAWGYIDERDVALACQLSLEADVAGPVPLIIAAADTVMDRPSADLAAEGFPGVPVRAPLSAHQTLLAIDRAREVIGFAPGHSWRDHVAGG